MITTQFIKYYKTRGVGGKEATDQFIEGGGIKNPSMEIKG